MAFTNLHTNKYEDEDLNATAFVISDAANKNLFGMTIDNTANVLASFVKLYFIDPATPPTIGTSQPDVIVRVEASKKQDFGFLGGSVGAEGIPVAGSNAVIHAVAVTTGGTAGTTAPANSVIAEFFTDVP
jgi:hypothetical protein